MNHTATELNSVREAASVDSTLMNDPWSYTDAEHCTVHARHIADVARAANAIQTITRLVSNSLQEPSLTGAAPLGQDAHVGLLQAAEIVGKYLGDLAESMAKTASMIETLGTHGEVESHE